MNQAIPSIGVEEEYQLVDPVSGQLIPRCKQVMAEIGKSIRADIQHELHLNQIEMASRICHTLADVRDSLCDTRHQLIEAARRTGAALVAAGTNPLPLPEDEALTPKERYRTMSQRYQLIARDLLIFGCHVHVSIPDKRLGLRVMNASSRWLPLLQALSANSPYWDGEDTGYSSFRRELWVQWPMAGAPPHFMDVDDYDACIDQLIRCGAIKDESFIYWDIRLPTKTPTIEFRAADVMLAVDEVVGYVGLVRALVMQATHDADDPASQHRIRPSILSHAIWQAARYGVGEDLVDPFTCERLSATVLAERMLQYIRPALDRSGDREIVEQYIQNVLDHGNGADRQRAEIRKQGTLSAMVRYAISETARVDHC